MPVPVVSGPAGAGWDNREQGNIPPSHKFVRLGGQSAEGAEGVSQTTTRPPVFEEGEGEGGGGRTHPPPVSSGTSLPPLPVHPSLLVPHPGRPTEQGWIGRRRRGGVCDPPCGLGGREWGRGDRCFLSPKPFLKTVPQTLSFTIRYLLHR